MSVSFLPYSFSMYDFAALTFLRRVVPIQNGEKLRDGLQSLSMKVIWESYADGGHWINEPKGIDHISAFLGAVGIKGIMD